MKSLVQVFTMLITLFYAYPSQAFSYGGGCGTACMSQMYNYCPTCGGMMMNTPSMMPWGMPTPYYWNTAPISYSNFYAPSPWTYSSAMPTFSPGVTSSYYPGGGNVFMAKPNLYVSGPAGTRVQVKLQLKQANSNWLVAIPPHGSEGWDAVLEKEDRVSVDGVTYGYLYSDYRISEETLQDSAGFCVDKKEVLPRMAKTMQGAGFKPREIAHFLDYWTVKLPKSEKFCVYPQDEKQLSAAAPIEITPAATSIRRLLFIVQVGEGLKKAGGKFAHAPKESWQPAPLRTPAANAITVREWGVGFLAAKP